MKKLLLGCIADDFTGATDLANNLVRVGFRVVQTIGIPSKGEDIHADCIVVALKSRTLPVADAVSQSLAACRFLLSMGAQQIYFKVCSTFDSTPQGNIGPVLEGLMNELGGASVLVTPAFPDAGRTVFQGHLFVEDVLLSESGMRDHPLTPMTDSNLVRVLQAQLNPTQGRRVGLLDYRCVARGSAAIHARISQCGLQGVTLFIADAINNDDLMTLGVAVRRMRLVCAGSGLAIGLAANWGLSLTAKSSQLPEAKGLKAIVSGSCSKATNAQVLNFIQSGGAAHAVGMGKLAINDRKVREHVAELVQWSRTQRMDHPERPVLIYSTAEPRSVKLAQRRLGIERAQALVEHVLSSVARQLVGEGVRQLVVAGGETAGACVHALEISRMQIGSQVDPGVPWCYAVSPLVDEAGLHVALKSGNFGAPDFFVKAFAVLSCPKMNCG